MTTSKDDAKGYKGHVEGSRKGKVHKLFDAQGPEAAWTLGLKLKLKEGTLRSWFGAWRGEAPKRKPSKAKPTKKKKTAPADANKAVTVDATPSVEAAPVA